MDIFTTADIQRLFHNKFVCVIGDSIQRGVYKDLVYLLQNNSYMDFRCLKTKGEMSFCKDQLVEGGVITGLHNGKGFKEVRQFQTDNYLLRYYYVTRCYYDYLETILLDLKEDPKPDLIIMNSCLWDITRYGASGYKVYEKNLQRLFHRVQEAISDSCLFLWLTALPIGKSISGGFLLKDLDFLCETMRFDVMVSNFQAHQVATDFGFDVLDLHHHFRDLTHWREKDGIHWNTYAHRRITELILTHVCHAWRVGIPHHNLLLERRSILGYDENQSEKQRKPRHERSVTCGGNYTSNYSNFVQNNNNNNVKFNNNNGDPFNRNFQESSIDLVRGVVNLMEICGNSQDEMSMTIFDQPSNEPAQESHYGPMRGRNNVDRHSPYRR